MSTLTMSYDCFMVTTNDVGPKLVVTADLVRIYGSEVDSRRRCPVAIVSFIDKNNLAPEVAELVMRNLKRSVFAPGSWAWYHNEQKLRLVFGNLYYEFTLDDGAWRLSIGLSGSRVNYPYAAVAVSEKGTIAKLTALDHNLEMYSTANDVSPIGRTIVAATGVFNQSTLCHRVGVKGEDVIRAYLDILEDPNGKELVISSFLTNKNVFIFVTNIETGEIRNFEPIDIQPLGGGPESVLIMFDFDFHHRLAAVAQGIKNNFVSIL